MGIKDIVRCPYCSERMEADFVDVEVGFVQCGPYHCCSCGASEIGPESDDWCYKDREGKTIYTHSKRRYWGWAKKKYHPKVDYSKSVLRYDAPFTIDELETGYYRSKISPYANTVGGKLVDHITAKEMYNIGRLDEKVFGNEQ